MYFNINKSKTQLKISLNLHNFKCLNNNEVFFLFKIPVAFMTIGSH